MNRNFLDIVEKRFSVRGYKEDPVKEEDIQYILQCVALAPTAANRQPFRFFIIKNHDVRMKLSESYARDWFREAPLHLVITGLTNINWKRVDGLDYILSDISIVFDHAIMAATERGLATCWIAAFDEKIVRNALNLPENEIPLMLSPLGYAKPEATRPRKRKEMDEIIVRMD